MRPPVLTARPHRHARKWLNLPIGFLMMMAIVWAGEGLYFAIQSAADHLMYVSAQTPWQYMPLGVLGAALCIGFCWLAGGVVGWLNGRDAD